VILRPGEPHMVVGFIAKSGIRTDRVRVNADHGDKSVQRGLCCINFVGRSSSVTRFQAAISKMSNSLFMKRTSSLTCGLQVIIRITSNPFIVAAAVFMV
jgi:hypothetical protein